MEELSPFYFGRTSTSETFYNRTADVAKLKGNFTNKINTILISPRRWGKSSLVHKVAAVTHSNKIKVIQLDLFSMRNEQEFYNILATEVIKATSSKVAEWLTMIKQFFKNITPKISVGGNPTQEIELSFEYEDIDKHYKELLNLAEKIAVAKGIHIVICIDEFQNLMQYQDPMLFQKRLRTEWQHHTQVTYCLYGSMQHTMTALFTKQSNPFYKFGELFFLQKIERKHWIAYITRQFAKTKKIITELQANAIAELVQDHSYYVQQLAHLVWVSSGKRVGANTVHIALNNLLNQNAILYQRDTELLSNVQFNYLKAVANDIHNNLSSMAIMQQYKLGTSANVLKIKKALIDKELIEDNLGKVYFIDPCYRLWYRKYILKLG